MSYRMFVIKQDLIIKVSLIAAWNIPDWQDKHLSFVTFIHSYFGIPEAANRVLC